MTATNSEMEIQHFHILEFDNKILGCAQVKHYDGISEIACFAINENYQNMGYGKKLLEYCENECKNYKQWNQHKILICKNCTFSYIHSTKSQVEDVFSPSEKSFIDK